MKRIISLLAAAASLATLNAQTTEEIRIMRVRTTNDNKEVYYEVSNVAEISFETKVLDISNEPSYVDLDLPSGNLWATFNLGAQKPWESGDYYAWGEVKTKKNFSWETYTMGKSSTTLTKYCNNPEYGLDGFVDGKLQLDSEDDAATQVWGKDWRMPTKADFDELKKQCTWTWTSIKGVYGFIVASKVNPEKNIFLPTTGYKHSNIGNGTTIGYYRTSTLEADNCFNAISMSMGVSGPETNNKHDRYCGRCIRPIFVGQTDKNEDKGNEDKENNGGKDNDEEVAGE